MILHLASSTFTSFLFDEDLDPYGLHLCLAMKNRFQLHLLANYELRLIHQYETRSIRNVVISHGGHLIAVISNNVIKIYSTVHFNLISQLRGHAGKIQQVLWCKNDSMLISCGTDGMIYTFNTLTGKCSSGDLRAIIPEIPGMREGEIITKQFRYLGVAATMDGQRIYAIASDSMIKIFSNTNLEREWPIENGFLPSAITLSKSERFLYVGMTHGIIRVYTLPFTLDAFVDVSAHSSTIRRLLVSADDQYLVSIAESAYILLFRQTTDLLNSMSSQYEFTHPTTVHVEIDMAQKPVRVLPTFEYILVTKSEFDEQRRKVKEIQARIE